MTGKTNQKESKRNPSRIEEKYLDKLHIRVAVKKNSKEPSLED